MGSQPITRLGDKTTGHGPYKPRPSTSASGDVKVNGIGAVRVDDTWAPHGPPPNNTHVGEVGIGSSGSGTVKVNNKPVARIGDAVEADTIAAGSKNVFAG
jgi:uncharacterized Zn-binding protein involved in type VI secretion